MVSAERIYRPRLGAAGRVFLLGFISLTWLFAARVYAEEAPDPSAIAGDYAGAWESDSGSTGSSAVSVTVDGKKITGSMNIMDSPSGYPGGELTVKVLGDADGMLKLRLTTRDSQFRATAFFNGDQMFGEYQIMAVKDRRQRGGSRDVLDRGRFALVKRQQ